MPLPPRPSSRPRFDLRVAAEPRAVRQARGRELRRALARSAHAGWQAPPDRADPVELIRATQKLRQRSLAPIRVGRMIASPFAFYRGAAEVMAADLAPTPVTGHTVQVCGDAHLMNFGFYASPERQLVFDVNDFDETIRGPWEWDVKRLAASVAVVAGDAGEPEARARLAATQAVSAYRDELARLAPLPFVALSYVQLSATTMLPPSLAALAKPLDRAIAHARHHTQAAALDRFTVLTPDGRRLRDEPPRMTRLSDSARGRLTRALNNYVPTLLPERRHVIATYRVVDAAHRIVGVGSVGTRCYVVYLEGGDPDDTLFLQLKQASPSQLAAYVSDPPAAQGERIVAGQRLIQTVSDEFLGWTSMDGASFYVRQMQDMKSAITVGELRGEVLIDYGRVCGAVLAKAHARTGDAALIAGYIGTSDRFAAAVGAWATGYAEQTRRDHAALVAAVDAGRIAARTGV